MIESILVGLLYLGAAVGANVILGLWHNIGTQHLKFDWKKLFQGLAKAACVGIGFVLIAYVFGATGFMIDLSVLQITPQTIMTSAIVLYTSKAITNLAKILGVSTGSNTKSKKE